MNEEDRENVAIAAKFLREMPNIMLVLFAAATNHPQARQAAIELLDSLGLQLTDLQLVGEPQEGELN